MLPNASVDIDVTEPRQTSNHPSFRFHPVHETEVLSHLQLLKKGKATGHDNIPSISIKIAQSSIYQNLSKIINWSLHHGIFPAEWKIAKISLVFKCNRPNDRDNYRPISILPCLSKLCESIVHNQLNDYSRCNQNIIQSKNQFAYTKHCSTATALLKVVDSWKFAVDQGKNTVAIFLDLRKPFDVINHDILLDKLRSIGLGEVETN